MGAPSVPLFPLPTAVLFPKAFMPLHIFEPRYRAMLADALRGERRIAMALLQEGGVREVCGVGVIVRHRARTDGTSDIVLWGEARARILAHELKPGGYLAARIQRLPDPAPQAEAAALARLREGLLVLLRGRTASRPPGAGLGGLADLAAAALLADPLERQAVLETLDVRERAERVLALLGRSLLEVGGVCLN